MLTRTSIGNAPTGVALATKDFAIGRYRSQRGNARPLARVTRTWPVSAACDSSAGRAKRKVIPGAAISPGTSTEIMPARPLEGARTTDTETRAFAEAVSTACAPVSTCSVKPKPKLTGNVASSNRTGVFGLLAGSDCGNDGGSVQVLLAPAASGPSMSAVADAPSLASR